MLARTEENQNNTPQQPEEKRRTITLTNRSPVSILESEWPVIAQGEVGYDVPGAPYGWTISIRVRKFEKKPTPSVPYDIRFIIHANYKCFDEDHDDDNQTVRVGRLLEKDEAMNGIWKHITGVGDELRERIESEKLRKHVIYAVDLCFANLPPVTE